MNKPIHQQCYEHMHVMRSVNVDSRLAARAHTPLADQLFFNRVGMQVGWARPKRPHRLLPFQLSIERLRRALQLDGLLQ